MEETKLEYYDYLNLDQILDAQKPRSDEPLELVFIVAHQNTELWFKVLIHELFHNLNLDFSTANISKSVKKLKSYCKLDSDYYIFETYCEIWGRILNVCIKNLSFK